MSDANREAFAPKCTCEHAHDFECPQHGTGAWQNAYNEGLEAAATRLENGRFLHDEAPDFLLSKQAAKAIRAMKLPEPQP
jgi:hypothetical protein